MLLRVRNGRAYHRKGGAITLDCPSGALQTHFFDLVPVDVLFLVLKHLSKQPFSEWCWLQSVNVNDVKTVLRLGGALSSASREVFKSLEHGLCSLDSLNELRMLIAACPSNVKIHGDVSVSHEVGVSNFILGIGTHLQYSLGTMPREILPALVNIEELLLYPVEGYSDEMIESIFVDPLPRLQKLTIMQMKSSKRLCIVARSATNLSEFVCSFGTGFEDYQEGEGVVEVRRVPVCGTDFIELLRRNVRLRFVGVNYGITREPVTNEITAFIPLLKVCGCLKHVYITNKMVDNIRSAQMPNSERLKEISDACFPLRNKSFSLSVDDVYYLPS